MTYVTTVLITNSDVMKQNVEITLGLVEITFVEGCTSFRRNICKTFTYVDDLGEHKHPCSSEQDVLAQLREITGKKVFFRNVITEEKHRVDQHGSYHRITYTAEVRY